MTGRIDHPRRKPTRLRVWDYASSAAGYFVTICTQNREHRLGAVVDRVMQLNEAGEMVSLAWIANAERYPDVTLDAFLVMPDHLHAVVFVGTDPAAPTNAGLTRVVQSFKSITTVEYGKGVRAGIHPPFDRLFWQRGFYDHIIRDDRDLERVRIYIEANPARWAEKHNHPHS